LSKAAAKKARALKKKSGLAIRASGNGTAGVVLPPSAAKLSSSDWDVDGAEQQKLATAFTKEAKGVMSRLVKRPPGKAVSQNAMRSSLAQLVTHKLKAKGCKVRNLRGLWYAVRARNPTAKVLPVAGLKKLMSDRKTVISAAVEELILHYNKELMVSPPPPSGSKKTKVVPTSASPKSTKGAPRDPYSYCPRPVSSTQVQPTQVVAEDTFPIIEDITEKFDAERPADDNGQLEVLLRDPESRIHDLGLLSQPEVVKERMLVLDGLKLRDALNSHAPFETAGGRPDQVEKMSLKHIREDVRAGLMRIEPATARPATRAGVATAGVAAFPLAGVLNGAAVRKLVDQIGSAPAEFRLIGGAGRMAPVNQSPAARQRFDLLNLRSVDRALGRLVLVDATCEGPAIKVPFSAEQLAVDLASRMFTITQVVTLSGQAAVHPVFSISSKLFGPPATSGGGGGTASGRQSDSMTRAELDHHQGLLATGASHETMRNWAKRVSKPSPVQSTVASRMDGAARRVLVPPLGTLCGLESKSIVPESLDVKLPLDKQAIEPAVLFLSLIDCQEQEGGELQICLRNESYPVQMYSEVKVVEALQHAPTLYGAHPLTGSEYRIDECVSNRASNPEVMVLWDEVEVRVAHLKTAVATVAWSCFLRKEALVQLSFDFGPQGAVSDLVKTDVDTMAEVVKQMAKMLAIGQMLWRCRCTLMELRVNRIGRSYWWAQIPLYTTALLVVFLLTPVTMRCEAVTSSIFFARTLVLTQMWRSRRWRV
jgi:hypothetical protein